MRHLQGRWPTPHIYVQWKVPSPATCDAARGASGAKASASSRLQEINAKRCCTNFFLQKDASQTSPCNMSLLQLCFAWPEIGLRSIVWRERRVAEAQGVLPKWLPQHVLPEAPPLPRCRPPGRSKNKERKRMLQTKKVWFQQRRSHAKAMT